MDTSHGSNSDVKEKFDWERFLQNSDLVPAPNYAFHHVDKCQQSLVEVGMMVEVQTSPLPRFWLAYVTLKCGPFLRLKYVGQEDPAKEIWTDPSSVEVRLVGYSSSRGWALEPPIELKNQKLSVSVAALVEQHRVLDCEASLLSPAQQMKVGTIVEVEDMNQPSTVWPAEIKRNVGGRLQLQYLLPKNVTATNACKEWIFCLSPRLHWRGWAPDSWTFQAPLKIRSLSDLWPTVLESYRASSVHSKTAVKPWTFNQDIPAHPYKVDDRIRALDPCSPTAIRSAVVVEVIDEQRYVIRIDPEANEEVTQLVSFYTGQANDDEGGSGFESQMAVEVVNPFKPDEMCVGVITSVEEDGAVLRIRPEVDDTPDFFVYASSHDLFPFGWCDSHGYPLTASIRVAHPEPSEPEPAIVSEKSNVAQEHYATF